MRTSMSSSGFFSSCTRWTGPTLGAYGTTRYNEYVFEFNTLNMLLGFIQLIKTYTFLGLIQYNSLKT